MGIGSGPPCSANRKRVPSVDIEVIDAILTEHPNGGRVWNVVYTAAGTVYSHVFPDSVFAWRVAEYNLDPTDTDALLDAVLYEAHIKQDPDHPLSLHNAPTIGDARAHYLAQLDTMKAGGKITGRRRRKTENRLIDPAKMKGRVVVDNADRTDSPLAMLKQHIDIHPDRVAQMRQLVAQHRNK